MKKYIRANQGSDEQAEVRAILNKLPSRVQEELWYSLNPEQDYSRYDEVDLAEFYQTLRVLNMCNLITREEKQLLKGVFLKQRAPEQYGELK